MRPFSRAEQRAALALIEHPHLTDQGTVHFSSVLSSTFVGPDHDISIYGPDGETRVAASLAKCEAEIGRKRLAGVLEVLSFYEFLEREGLLVFLDTGALPEKFEIGTQYKDGKTVWLPSSTSIFIRTRVNSFVLVTEALRRYIERGFVSDEENRHRRSIFFSRVALAVAVIIGLYGVFRDYWVRGLLVERHEEISHEMQKHADAITSAIESRGAEKRTPEAEPKVEEPKPEQSAPET